MADVLLERSVPFAFATGGHLDAIPQRFADAALCRKPNDPTLLVRQVADLLAT